MRRARRSQAQWENYCTDALPGDIKDQVLKDARDLYPAPAPPASSPWAPMNLRLAEHRRGFKATNIHRAYDPQAIRDYAKNAASVAQRLEPASAQLSDQLRALERRQHLAQSMGVQPPAERNYTIEGRLKRLAAPKWWRRQFRKGWTRASEGRCRDIGLVRKGRQPYVSDAAVRNRLTQNILGMLYLQGHQVVNEEGTTLSLWEVASHSLANVEVRRGELMTRARGFEECAQLLGHHALFVTLTCPSAFHAQLAAGGANPAYRKSTVRAAQRWLSKMWARARARLKRLEVLVYGFRMAEPHHDGTPHWHILLHGRAEGLDQVKRVLSYFWLSEYPDEPGAQKHRVGFETIDPAKGSAVGYIAKYISKNIDGAGSIGQEVDLESGGQVHANCLRVRAWASVHGIRQFQQIGGPPVGIWREARKLREGVEDLDIRAVVEAADRGDWCRFVFNVGGIHCGRRTNIRLRKEETGASNQYGEFVAARIIGLQYASALEITRPHIWRIEKCASTYSLASAPPSRSASGFESADVLGLSKDSEFSQVYETLALQASSVNPPPPELTPAQSQAEYFSNSESGSVSTLGPVTITVRGARYVFARCRLTGQFAWYPAHVFDTEKEDSS